VTARELIHFLTEEFIDLDDPVMVPRTWPGEGPSLLSVVSVRSVDGRIDLDLG
jgi:hypothetical protein